MNKQYESARNRTPQEQVAANAIDYIMQSNFIEDINLRLAVRDVCAYAADKLRQPNPTCLRQETTRIDSRGFVHNSMLRYHLEDIESAAAHIGIELTQEEIKKVAIAIFEDNDELALRIGDLILNEAIETIKHLKNS